MAVLLYSGIKENIAMTTTQGNIMNATFKKSATEIGQYVFVLAKGDHGMRAEAVENMVNLLDTTPRTEHRKIFEEFLAGVLNPDPDFVEQQAAEAGDYEAFFTFDHYKQHAAEIRSQYPFRNTDELLGVAHRAADSLMEDFVGRTEREKKTLLLNYLHRLMDLCIYDGTELDQ